MDNAYLNFKYKPVKFYLLVFLISWAAFFLSAYFSYSEATASYKFAFLCIAILIPCAVALFMVFGSKNAGLKKDFLHRLTDLKLIKPPYLLFLLLLMPVTVLLSTAISLLFGRPAAQFAFTPDFFNMGGAAIVVWIMVILAPTFEELGWRGYGVDSLAKKGRSLFVTTMIFAALWDVWHWPLFLINGYYHNAIMQASFVYDLNFVVSVFPMAFLHNWVYYRCGRSITAVILFHAVNNLAMSIWQTEQFTKCITTVVLLVFAVIVLWKDKTLWLEKQGQ
ncbi:MAG: CPBP family intramembrane metalloprotease [Dehalococcoidia bacterium]|nr:CPBP family intramembrane metalloprotease [Dehalococcoidia bacterium]